MYLQLISVRISSPALELERPAGAAEVDPHRAGRPQAHLDPRLDRVPERDVLERVRVELRADARVERTQRCCG